MPRSLNKIKLKDIHLTLWNPRFEIINSPEFDYISKILKEDSNYNDEKELETIIKLFSEDEKIFKELFHSINLDFIPENEEIQLIYNKKSRKYIVFDGNRRISCLKIFQNINKYMKKLEPYSKNYAFGSTYYQNKKNFYQFLKEINKNINEIISELYEKQFKIFNDNKTIHRLLFKKHSSGDLVGFKPWNKSKYYLDLFSMFKNKGWLLKEDLKKIEVEIIANFNKTPSQLYKDYTSACWIIQVFSDISKQNEEIYNDIIAIKPSAFEINFIKSTINYCIDLIKNNRFENIKIEDYFNLSFKKELRCWVNEGGWEINSIIQFIKKLKDEKIQTTRNIKPNQKNKLMELFWKHFNIGDIITKNNQFISNFSYLRKSELKQIKKTNWLNDHKNKDDIISLIEQRIAEFDKVDSIISAAENIKKNSWILELYRQIEHNSHSEKFYINAINSAIRTIYEFIIKLIWLQCIINLNDDIIKNKYSSQEEESFWTIWKKDKNNKIIKISYSRKIEEKQDILIALLVGTYSGIGNKGYIENFCTIFSKAIRKQQEGFKSKIFKDAFEDFFNVHYKNSDCDKCDQNDKFDIANLEEFTNSYYSPINDFIHKSYVKNFYEKVQIRVIAEFIKKNNEILKNFLEIVKHIKTQHIENIMTEISDNIEPKDIEKILLKT